MTCSHSPLATADIAWSQRPGLALPEAWEKGMDDALDAAVADIPDTAPLRSLLAGIGPTTVRRCATNPQNANLARGIRE
ncbi:hypothetical protein ACFVXE_24680 [Streptomyces sp. NPDC058231]|uniref:hypothetical protein n=1 Tax=Streptomyces sp. NPDC058231 TaxID=3346392 RepID=UPI0036E0BE37